MAFFYFLKHILLLSFPGLWVNSPWNALGYTPPFLITHTHCLDHFLSFRPLFKHHIFGSDPLITCFSSPFPLQCLLLSRFSCVRLCATPWTACRMPGFPVHHQLLELIQTHVHRVGDAIQPFHPLSSASPLVFNFSQHQGLFQ